MNDDINNESYSYLRKPKEQKYIAVNFETVGKFHKCGNTVISSIGYTDTNCSKCGLKLFWNKQGD